MRFSIAEAVDAAGIDRAALAQALPRVDATRVPVWEAARWFRFFWARGVTAVALPWGVYVHPDRLRASLADLGPLMVHELTHIEQWRRLGAIGWLRSYVGDYLRSRRGGLPHHDAYRAIGLEVEARGTAARLSG
ncbi:MAG: hypothetical protein WD184_04475 [Acidimicrobiia bacterium]